MLKFGGHSHYTKNGIQTSREDVKIRSKLKSGAMSEDVYQTLNYGINHYRIKSVESNYKKKQTEQMPSKGRSRSSVQGTGGAYFHNYEYHGHEMLWDIELASKQHWKGLGCTNFIWAAQYDNVDALVRNPDGSYLVDLNIPAALDTLNHKTE